MTYWEGPIAQAHPMTLDEYQGLAAETDIEGESAAPTVALLGLAGEVGGLLAEYKKKVRPDGRGYVGFEDSVQIELGDILWYLATLARRLDLPLSVIAASNLMKTRSRWLPSTDKATYSFDEGVPEAQRLPRQFSVTFQTVRVESGHDQCRMYILGEELGDPIDDNARHEDFYRFHDVFHLAHAAVLGWSPVVRLLLRRKRRYELELDRIEDGARAIATEEAITALIFSLAKDWNYFEGAHSVDSAITGAVQAVAGRLEVGARTDHDWEAAILQGFKAWRFLRDNNGG